MKTDLVKSSQNLISGLILIAFAAIAVWSLSNLSQGTVTSIGPAMVPRTVALLIGLGGVVLVVLSLLHESEPLERWHVRGPVFVSLGLIAFALTIKVPGFLVAAPLSMMIAGWGSQDARLRELIIFSVALTGFCILLFKVLLGQQLPILVIHSLSIRI